MKIVARSLWDKQYYIKKWCCGELKGLSTCEDEGILYLPFYFKYCPFCGKKIMLK